MASREYASMVGGGFYNQFSSGQLRAALLAVPDLADAVLAVAKFKKSKNTADKIVINMADFGSSEGRNSIAVFVDTFTQLKDKLDAAIEISVTHTDVPTNDYNELFKHVHTSSYLKGVLTNKIYSMASASSFYEQIFPTHTLDVGFSSTALHWMSCTPCGLTDHVAPNKSTAKEVEVWREQARHDWEQILCHRANELAAGGRLVLVVLAVNDQGRMNTMFFLDNFNRKLHQMRDAGVITADEFNAANLPMWFRTKHDVMRAFTEPSSPQVAQQLSQLKVLRADVRVMPCPYYEQYKQGNVSKEKFARDYVSSCKAWSKPILTGAFKDPQVLDQAYDHVVEQIIKSTEAEFTGDDYVEVYINIEKL